MHSQVPTQIQTRNKFDTEMVLREMDGSCVINYLCWLKYRMSHTSVLMTAQNLEFFQHL